MLLTIKFGRKNVAFTLTWKFKVHLHWDRDEIYAVVLRNDFRRNLIALFWTMCKSVKGLYDIKSCKISTAFDVWFSRYRPCNMKLSTDTAVVLVFINFLAAVYVHPCEKVIGMFFQNQIWSRLLDINRMCLVFIKRSIGEVKKCQISKRGYQQRPSDETLKSARCQFCDDKFGHRITEAVGFFDYKMRKFTQITFNFTNRWSKDVVSWFLISFCIRNIFMNYILSNKWM